MHNLSDFLIRDVSTAEKILVVAGLVAVGLVAKGLVVLLCVLT